MAPEMLALSIVELILTFTLALILLAPSSAHVNFKSVHVALICSVTVCFTAFVIGLYRPQIFERARGLLFSTMLSALLSFPAIWIVSKGLGLSDYWPVGYDSLRPVKIVIIWSLGVLCLRLLFLAATRFNMFLHRVALVSPTDSPSVLAAVRAGRKGFLEISSILPEHVSAEHLSRSGIRTLVIAGDSANFSAPKVHETLIQRGIRIQTDEEFWERYLRRVDISKFKGFPSELVLDKSDGKAALIVSRTFDICVSLALLFATLPIMVTVAIIVRLDSSGSILYRQERVGHRNISFVLLKFRSMRADAEASGPRWAQQKDPRVTRVGQFMRKTRIDELPQLLNILRGEMSFIGPRPERPHFVEQLSEVIPNYSERLRVKPGLTGWAQVNYPYGASVEDARAKLSYDLYYVKNRSIILDILILLSTVRVILLQEGAR